MINKRITKAANVMDYALEKMVATLEYDDKYHYWYNWTYSIIEDEIDNNPKYNPSVDLSLSEFMRHTIGKIIQDKIDYEFFIGFRNKSRYDITYNNFIKNKSRYLKQIRRYGVVEYLH